MEESLPVNQAAVRAKPNDAIAHSQLGSSYFFLGRLEEAETHLRRAKALDPGHFSLPDNGPNGLEGRVYFVDYQGVRFIVLDAQYHREEQSKWLDGVLANNPNTWTIVAFHEPVFSIAMDRDEHNTRDAFMSLIDKYSVDLVLTGHDHGYARSKRLRDGKVVGEGKRGTVYVVSVCGPQGYSHNPKYDRLMAKTGTYVQLFQVISLSNNALRYKSYTVTGKLYDSFELKKDLK